MSDGEKADNGLGREKIRESIEYLLAPLVSGNKMPHMSGDPRRRLNPGQRIRMEDTAREIMSEIVDPLRSALVLIAQTDPVDATLDPERAIRVAVAALRAVGHE